jgi:hypothetical protein
MIIREPLFTTGDLLALPHDRARYALVKGRLIEMSPLENHMDDSSIALLVMHIDDRIRS